MVKKKKPASTRTGLMLPCRCHLLEIVSEADGGSKINAEIKVIDCHFTVSLPEVCLYDINEYVRSPALNEIPKFWTGRYSKESKDSDT